nr:hypothetical protein [uncultured Halomonas sp.]
MPIANLTPTLQKPPGFWLLAAGRVGRSNMINIGLAAGTSGEQFRQLVEQQWLPELETFQPELIFISAGFDGHREDDMSDLDLVEEDFAWVTREVKKIADNYAQGRIVSTLEGGYVMSALGRSVASHIDALL